MFFTFILINIFFYLEYILKRQGLIATLCHPVAMSLPAIEGSKNFNTMREFFRILALVSRGLPRIFWGIVDMRPKLVYFFAILVFLFEEFCIDKGSGINFQGFDVQSGTYFGDLLLFSEIWYTCRHTICFFFWTASLF